MEHLRYYVVVANPADKEPVLAELKARDGTDHIPAREVDADDEMAWSEHNSIFLLTEEEAEILKNDPRILDVHRDPMELGERPRHCGIRTGVYERSTNPPTTSSKNWGLVRSLYKNNFYGASTTTNVNYTYNLDGTGVDIIVMDTGVEPYHPEFAVNADGSGGTRVVDYNWTVHGIISSVPTGGFLGDCDGHGSNVASIIAGNTCGWASGAKIYSLRTVPNTGGTEYDMTDGRVLGLLNEIQCWGSIRAFHNAKPVDPTTGYKRPTIVNCSYGYPGTYATLKSITYRGTTYTTSTTNSAYGTLGDQLSHGVRYSSIDAEVSSTLNAGVIIIGAAGNDAHKIDISSGTDYNNYWTKTNNAVYYYHRGSTPTAVSGVICVGTTSATANGSGVEHKKNFSCTGPRVDIWAPGDQIMGAFSSSTYVGPAVLDSRGSVSTSSGRSFYLQKISGTSQASPQVAGVLALVLQARPWMTPAQARSWIIGAGAVWSADESYYGGSGYSNYAALQGANSLLLHMPYNSATVAVFSLG
jgi:hypothetical protein